MCIIRFYWLIALYIFTSLVLNTSFLIINTVVSGKKSVMSTNHCSRTACWCFRACAPYLWFMHLHNWHFSLHLQPLQRPSICAVEDFQRFRFSSLPISSHERVKKESTFTFTFILRTIYEVNGTARYLESCWPATDNDAILTLYFIHTIYLSLSAFYRASNQLIHWSIDQWINGLGDGVIDRWIDGWFDWCVDQCIDGWMVRSING